MQLSCTSPPGHTDFSAHWVHSMPSGPTNPGRHLQSVRLDDPGGDSELTGQELIRPLKHTSPGSHVSHLELFLVVNL